MPIFVVVSGFKNDSRSIGVGAFDSCESLTSFTIPKGVKSIGDSAFFRCTSLTSITIPDTVTSIGNWAFYPVDNLTIYGAKGSYAECYAKEKGINFSVKTAGDLVGDANVDGKVNVKDATLIQKYAASLESLSGKQMSLADVNADTKVNVKDATAIQKYTAGIKTGLPICEEV